MRPHRPLAAALRAPPWAALPLGQPDRDVVAEQTEKHIAVHKCGQVPEHRSHRHARVVGYHRGEELFRGFLGFWHGHVNIGASSAVVSGLLQIPSTFSAAEALLRAFFILLPRHGRFSGLSRLNS